MNILTNPIVQAHYKFINLCGSIPPYVVENQILANISNLPDYVKVVQEGKGPATVEYWNFLISQVNTNV